MRRLSREIIGRQLDQAEGYLMLNLPLRALAILQSREEWPKLHFRVQSLTGQALLNLGHYVQALQFLERAATVRPDDVTVAIGLAGCYRHTHRLAQAIEALERVIGRSPDQAELHYNLACYWSLAGNTDRAISRLASAVELLPDYRFRIGEEPDFEQIRSDPRFNIIVSGARSACPEGRTIEVFDHPRGC